MLGPLLDYDERNRAEMIKTLEAFFACHGNLSKTAEKLIVHRNTLLYRMKNRVEQEIADIDINGRRRAWACTWPWSSANN